MKISRMIAVGSLAVFLILGLLCLSDWWFPAPPPMWFRSVLWVIGWPSAIVASGDFSFFALLPITGLVWAILVELFLTLGSRKETNGL